MSELQKAKLENWSIIDFGTHFSLSGNAYGHPRFVDGTFIYTSRVPAFDLKRNKAKQVELNEGDVVTTMNTEYTLGKYRGINIPVDEGPAAQQYEEVARELERMLNEGGKTSQEN
jgi:hypothetical protein